MNHRGACAPSLALRGLSARMCVSPTVRYVPIAGHHVTCQGSRVLGQVFQSQIIHGASSTATHTARPSRAHLRSTLRNEHWRGWVDGCMDA